MYKILHPFAKDRTDSGEDSFIVQLEEGGKKVKVSLSLLSSNCLWLDRYKRVQLYFNLRDVLL